jgi:hypothetical protein
MNNKLESMWKEAGVDNVFLFVQSDYRTEDWCSLTPGFAEHSII